MGFSFFIFPFLTSSKLSTCRSDCWFRYLSHLIGQEYIGPLWWINQLINQVNQLIQLACNKRGSTNKSLTKLKMQQKINWHSDCLWIGKTYMAKTLLGDFKVTTSENSLLSQQAITSKGISVPYTNLQLNPYPNIQLDLFCNDNLSFQCTAPSTWLTNSMCGS